MSGKVKSLYGVYKALGRDAFLAAAQLYTGQVQKTVEATLLRMESSWYDEEKRITEADAMVRAYQEGALTHETAAQILNEDRVAENFGKNINEVLKSVDFVRLESSLESADKSYAGEVLKETHDAFLKTYGADCLERDKYGFVGIPAVIRSDKTGKLSLGVVTIDLESSGEHWGTAFLTPYGVVSQGDENAAPLFLEYISENFIPYRYWYTAEVEGDVHVDNDNIPDAVADLIAQARGEQQNNVFDLEM